MTIRQMGFKRNDLRGRHGVIRVAFFFAAILLLLPASKTLAKPSLPELLSANAKCVAAYEYLEGIQDANQNSDAKETRDTYRELATIHRESSIVLGGAKRAAREADRARNALARRVGALELNRSLGLLAQETVACEGLPEYLTEAQLARVFAAVERKSTSK